MSQPLIETYSASAVAPDVAIAALRQRAATAGVALASLETDVVHYPFVVRRGTVSGLLYAYENVFKSRTPMPFQFSPRYEEEDRFLGWELAGCQGIAAGADAPTDWIQLPEHVSYAYVGAEPFPRVDASMTALDERMRDGVARALAEDAEHRSWTVVRLKVDVFGATAPFQTRVPFVRMRFRVEPPGFGKAIRERRYEDWHTAWYTLDGRLLCDAMPVATLHPAVWLVGGAVLVVVMLVFVLALAVFMWLA